MFRVWLLFRVRFKVSGKVRIGFMVRFMVRVRFELGYREWRGLANLST